MGDRVDRLAQATILEQLPLNGHVESKEFGVRLEGEYGCHVGSGVCVPLHLLFTAVNTSREERLQAREKLYWPRRGDRMRQQLLLLLLAEAYPYPVSVPDLREVFEEYGLPGDAVRKLLYRYYYYYRVVERVGYGLYRLRDEYYELLAKGIPEWRAILYCIRSALSKHVNVACERLITNIKILVTSNVTRYMKGSRSVAFGREKSRWVTSHVTERDSTKNNKKGNCRILIDRILEVLKNTKPILYDELGGDKVIAAELIGVLYKRAKTGPAYVAGNSPGVLHTALADEAYSLWGSSSRLYRSLDWDTIRPLIPLLSAGGILFTGRYGGVFKIRLDRNFEDVLDGEGVMECG